MGCSNMLPIRCWADASSSFSHEEKTNQRYPRDVIRPTTLSYIPIKRNNTYKNIKRYKPSTPPMTSSVSHLTEGVTQVRQLIRSLKIFVPGYHRRPSVVPWLRSPVTLSDFASLKLVGVHKRNEQVGSYCIQWCHNHLFLKKYFTRVPFPIRSLPLFFKKIYYLFINFFFFLNITDFHSGSDP